MAYIGTQPNDQKKNIGLYSPSEILQLTKDGSWGGSLELIAEENYSSSVSYVDFLNIKENVFDVHLLQINSLKISPTNIPSLSKRLFNSSIISSLSKGSPLKLSRRISPFSFIIKHKWPSYFVEILYFSQSKTLVRISSPLTGIYWLA